MTGRVQTHISKLDKSVNWVIPFGKGAVETRFVQKRSDYIISYVSSHSGCRMGCQFCYLTQQKQTSFDHVDIQGYRRQLSFALRHYMREVARGAPRANRVNVNFMARGEALSNKWVVNHYPKLYQELNKLTVTPQLSLKMNISTIMPHTVGDRELRDIFRYSPANVYYSLYSLDDGFRDKWMPNAMPVHRALQKLRQYEIDTEGVVDTPVTFHWAYIKGHNDDITGAHQIAKQLKSMWFRAKFNLVRFNPHPNLERQGIVEPEEPKLMELFSIISDALGHDRSYMVPRVGRDVSASCGMFIEQ